MLGGAPKQAVVAHLDGDGAGGGGMDKEVRRGGLGGGRGAERRGWGRWGVGMWGGGRWVLSCQLLPGGAPKMLGSALKSSVLPQKCWVLTPKILSSDPKDLSSALKSPVLPPKCSFLLQKCSVLPQKSSVLPHIVQFCP